MNAWSRQESVDALLRNAPPVPAVARYYDDFSDSYGQVTDANVSEHWTISFDGRNATLDFGRFDIHIRGVVQCWCATILGALSPRTVQYYYYGLRKIPAHEISVALTSMPHEIRSFWKKLHAEHLPYDSFEALHNLITFCCKFRIASWGPEWLDLVSQLPLPKVDKYASVRVGDVFLSAEEEAAIIRHIDRVTAQVQAGPAGVGDDVLEPTTILICSYHFGLRAKQIAMLEMRNIRIWKDGVDGRPAVHLTFVMIKQRSAKRVFPMVQRIKREWAPLFEELYRRALAKDLAGSDHVFCRTPIEVGKILADLTEVILKERRTVRELRHTAAQRLVDAGASEEDLATFMGHSDLNTGLIYFRSSASQGDRINQALGLSGVYQRVVKIAHDRFISAKDLVPAAELYTHLTGNPFVADLPQDVRRQYIETYQKDYNPDVFDRLRAEQLPTIRAGKSLRLATYAYFQRFTGAPFRKANGEVWEDTRILSQAFLKVDEVEGFLKRDVPTKQSDVTPIKLAIGELAAWELMFLMPKRALSEGGREGLCDVTRYCAVGRTDRNMITSSLSGEAKVTLFEAYGQSDEDRQLTIRPHSLRHLQNTELFRLGVADTIITKRFNRRQVAQSYEYDHRSLAEDLDQIDLKPEVEARLGEKSATVARLIKSGKARGPIVEAFKNIQQTQGEDAALEFLRGEADGFHSTPYGHCINSFTVDPCPKHLECFTGCRHLSASDLTENRDNLVQLQVRLETAVQAIEARQQRIGRATPLELDATSGDQHDNSLTASAQSMRTWVSSGIGMENQLSHAKVRLSGVRKLLETPPGHLVFPDGPDLSGDQSKPIGRVLDDIL